VRGARRWLILAHRYLGILLAPLFLVWFVSGITMVYLRAMPEVNARQRLAHLPPIDTSAIRVSPVRASQLAGLDTHPGHMVLTTVLNRPAYRIRNSSATVFADTGERLEQIGESDAAAVAGRFLSLPPDRIGYAEFLAEADQWTLAARRQMPLYRLVVDDAARTEIYVSATSAEVVNVTTRRSRALAWISAIPHWLYFAWLRSQDRLWRQVVLWTAGLAVVSSFIGLVLAIVQLSVRYQGWLLWHYRAGVIFGVVTLTWVFSGFLSMEPWFWARGSSTGPADRIADALSGGALDVSVYPALDTAKWLEPLEESDVREVELLQIRGEPYLALRDATGGWRLLEAATLREQRAPFATESMVALIKAAVPDSPVAEVSSLDHYDAYYYGRDALPLPVLRVKFDDRESTWVYIDPSMSRVTAQVTRRARVQRWLYHGLHSLDFPWLYDRRPLWDIVVVTLCLGGVGLSAIGLVLAGKRIARRLPR
jgi:hypothetical protein